MTFDPIIHWLFVALVGLALFAFSYRMYRPTSRGRQALLALRTLAILILVGVMLRPSLIVHVQERLGSTLVFLVDKSRSMLLNDETAGRTRWEAVRMDLDGAREAIDDLSQDVRIHWYEFGADTRAADLATLTDTAPADDKTAIGEALKRLQKDLAGERLAGVVLLSDGANTAGTSPVNVARQYRAVKTPVHCVGYGQEVMAEQARDLAARGLRVNPTVFAKNKLPVVGELDVAGFAGQTVSTKLLFNGVEQSRSSFSVGEGANRTLAELQGTPLTPGDMKVTFEAAVPGDRQSANNSVSTWVTVLAGGISVLQIEGKYRFWEPKFLRWALDQSADIELAQLFLLSQGGRVADLPEELLQPGAVDVFILGDIAANQFSEERLRRLAERVEKEGAGLLFIGGYDAFGPGGWGTSPLAGVLPVLAKPSDQQITSPISFVPTEPGIRHFVLRLVGQPEENARAWASLRPLDGGSSWTGLKPGAQLLAAGSDGQELLVAQTVGAGRVIAFAGDTTWRWRKDDVGIAHHARFWRQLILWLAKKEDAGSPQLRVTLPTRRLAVGQQLPITVFAQNTDGSPISDAVLQAQVVTPTGSRVPVELFRQGDTYQGTFYQTLEAGDLTLEVAGTAAGKDLGTASTKFLVYAEDTEGQQPAADLSLLNSLADATGGQFRRHLDLADLVRELGNARLNRDVSQPRLESIWDRWEVLALFISILAVEWVLRKRMGMA
jgi:uncharacterized membrane protein